MTDLLRLATELERSGGMHRFVALVQAASLVLLRFEHGESVTVRGERWPLPVSDCQDEPRITHAPDSPIPALVREPARKLVPRPWQRPTDPTIEAEDPA
ncbi:MAG: hypothetical protein U1E60_32100 [Reyranellaceae bacterium]